MATLIRSTEWLWHLIKSLNYLLPYLEGEGKGKTERWEKWRKWKCNTEGVETTDTYGMQAGQRVSTILSNNDRQLISMIPIMQFRGKLVRDRDQMPSVLIPAIVAVNAHHVHVLYLQIHTHTHTHYELCRRRRQTDCPCHRRASR